MFQLVLAIGIWGLVHSLTASLGFKALFRRTVGNEGSRLYRLLYNIFAALSFGPVLYLMLVLPDRSFYQVPAPWSLLMRAGQGVAALLLVVSLLQTDVLSFAGVRQIFQAEQPGKLVTSGLYRYVRHPLYTFGLSVIWLSPSVSVNSFVVYVSLTLYILVGIYFEERKLLREFGQAYADYRASTPVLIPGLRFGGNK